MNTGVMSPSSARDDTGLRQGCDGDAQLPEFSFDNSADFFKTDWSGFSLPEQQDSSQMQSYPVPSGTETGWHADYLTTPPQPGIGSGFNQPIRDLSVKFPSQRIDPSRMNSEFLIRSNSSQAFDKALQNCKRDSNLPLPGSNPFSTPAPHMLGQVLPQSEVSPGTIPPYQPLSMTTTRSTPSMCTPSVPGFAMTPSSSIQMQTVAPQMLQYSISTPGFNSAPATSGLDTNGFIQDGSDPFKIEEDLYSAPTPRPVQPIGAVAHEAQRSTKKRTYKNVQDAPPPRRVPSHLPLTDEQPSAALLTIGPMSTAPKGKKRRKTSTIPPISISNHQANLVNRVIEENMTKAYEAGCEWSYKHMSTSLRQELKMSGSLAGQTVMLQGNQVTQNMKDTVTQRLNGYLGRAKAHSPKDKVLDAIHTDTRKRLHDLGIVAFAHF
ncbi:hypothetical protein E4U17_000009 [Claviceps sp. LM77 group G4]|nr:hypothetical protein E4U17_000009 [Claviceps sp. LM77 group G4]KAG6085834.1 hypothetical protein E4U16_000047 [Claviceps sp. LM84 group G4]